MVEGAIATINCFLEVQRQRYFSHVGSGGRPEWFIAVVFRFSRIAFACESLAPLRKKGEIVPFQQQCRYSQVFCTSRRRGCSDTSEQLRSCAGESLSPGPWG